MLERERVIATMLSNIEALSLQVNNLSWFRQLDRCVVMSGQYPWLRRSAPAGPKTYANFLDSSL